MLLWALRQAIKSYRGQRSDYQRHTRAISLHPEWTGIPDLTEISCQAAGTARLAAWYAPSHNGAAVVLVHGTDTDRSGVLFETRFLATAGFGVLALDLPGQGASAGRSRWGVPERAALMAAVTWLAQRDDIDPRRIGGYGQSMGAYVLTQAAVLDSRLRALTLAASPNDVIEQNWRASARWGLLTQLPSYWALRAGGHSLDMKPKDIIERIAPRAIFILGGEQDTLVPPYMAHQLFAAAREPKELWIVPGAHHVDYSLVAPDEYRTRVTQFFLRTLLD